MAIFPSVFLTFFGLFTLITLNDAAVNTDCYSLEMMFPMCACEAALDDNGQETSEGVVDCSSRNLSQVPPPQSVSYNKIIYEIRLNNNNISSLEDTAFSGLKIRKLDLSGNAISHVANNTFLNVDLKILYIDGNSNSPPPANAFINLASVEELVLRNYKVPDLQPKLYFKSLTNLKHLSLDHCEISIVEPEAFFGPSSLQSLVLTNQELHSLFTDELQEQHLRSLQKLKISFTKIRSIPRLSFQPLSLVELDLSNNDINDLRTDCFSGLGDSLKKLNLQNNVLVSGDPLSGLKTLTHLEELDLSSNVISSFPNLSGLGTTKPLKLYLTNNEISSLPANAFSGIAGVLHTLDLSGNKIGATDNNSFNGVTSLNTLIIKSQSIRDTLALIVPASLTQTAGTLSRLDLGDQKVDPNALWPVVTQLQNLKVLNLNSVGLQTIPDRQLVNLTMLQELDLSGNGLSEITQLTLAGPQSTLKYLYLSGNPISSITSCAFYGYSSFPITISLNSNNLLCDCALKWLWERIQNRTITFSNGHEPKCSNHNDQLLADLDQTALCNSPNPEDSCIQFTTQPAPTTPLSTPRPVKLTISLGQIQNTSITISWSLTDPTNLKQFIVKVTNQFSVSEFSRTIDDVNIRMLTATGLRADTHHNLCVTAMFTDRASILSCGTTRTLPGPTTADTNKKDSGSEEIGIIVGAVLGALVVIGILVAIFILLFIRKRPNKADKNLHIQPRNFSKSELPSMNGDTRVFAKPKKRSSNTGSDSRDGMQIVAISDGQASGGRVGRAHMLNSDGSYKTMGDTKTSNQSTYENDHGPLPAAPTHQPAKETSSYYNEAFRNDKYDEIDPEREIIL